uniref:Uncharacterized protein n=1 Tax=Corethron hystrix TaxID=216773 RepID=A0A7S1B932_9STRA
MTNLLMVSYLGPRGISVNELQVQGEAKIHTPSLKNPLRLGVFIGGMLILLLLIGSKKNRDENRNISIVSTTPGVIKYEPDILIENHPLREICMENSFQPSQISDIADADYESLEYVPPSIHDLARIHSTTDVHKCVSTTCAVCSRTKVLYPVFVPAISCQRYNFNDSSS